ncbi:hypothetical protein HPP92_013030 [Vanilla planifolia]|uniref:Acid phosphatase n=1 Tax=Vanilla planifolia TaxID=51239 RepID=A0A835QU61_VANPL|nr:hypothetical protein HPP92_013030 [Vanilla planifolia]
MKFLRVAFPLLLLAASLCFSAVAEKLIHALRPQFGCAGTGLNLTGVSCTSWQLAVETHNLRDWPSVPTACESYFGNYMLGGHYRNDSRVVVDEAIKYALDFKSSSPRGIDIWIFDIDETSLSNLPYLSQHGFGVEPINHVLFAEWILKGSAPPLPETLKLYNVLIKLGIKVVFLSDRTEKFSASTAQNLKRAGYHTWHKLILRNPKTNGTELQHKSDVRDMLQRNEYRIVGNIGDQWSDILGSPEGERTFKLPDPMYYIS